MKHNYKNPLDNWARKNIEEFYKTYAEEEIYTIFLMGLWIGMIITISLTVIVTKVIL